MDSMMWLWYNLSNLSDEEDIDYISTRWNQKRKFDDYRFSIVYQVCKRIRAYLNGILIEIKKNYDTIKENYDTMFEVELTHDLEMCLRIAQNDSLKENIVNCVISLFLTNWLKTVLPEEKTIYKWIESESDRRKDYRYRTNYIRLLESARQQAELEGAVKHVYRHDLTYSKQSVLDIWKIMQMSLGKNNVSYIYDLAKDEKKRQPSGNTRLVDAYINFYEQAKALNPASTKVDIQLKADDEDEEQFELPDDMNYVFSAIDLCEMEYCSRYHLFAMISKYYAEHEAPIRMPPDQFVSYATEAGKELNWFFPYDRFYPLWGRCTDICNDLLMLLDYQFEIPVLFAGTHLDKVNLFQRSKEEFDEYVKAKHYQSEKDQFEVYVHSRIISTLLYITATVRLPFKKLPRWSEQDFKAARHFFETDYPVYKIYEQFCEANDPYEALTETKAIDDRTSFNRDRRIIDYIRALMLKIGEDHEKIIENISQMNTNAY